MLIFLQRNLAWMLLAVALSTSLWIVVTTQQNPDVIDFFDAIPVEARNQPTELVLRSEIPPVRLRVIAPRDVWTDLRRAKFQASVDLSRLGPGLQEVPIQVQTVESRARIDEVSPSKALVHLERVQRKEVPTKAKVAGDLPTGYRAQTAKAAPETIVASGPESLVGQVVAAVAEVDLTGVTSSVSQVYKVVPQNANGERIDRISLSSENVVVDVRIEQERAIKTVPVAPQTVGSVAAGYQILGLRADPSAVTVEGLPSVIDSLSFLRTQAVELNNATESKQASVALQLPEGIRPTRAEPVVVTVFVAPVEGSKVVEVAPAVQQLGRDLRVSVVPSSVRLTVVGPMPILTGLGPAEAKVLVNAGGLTPGVHQIQPRVELPSLVRLQGSEPERVELRIQPVEPTPTPPAPTPSPTRASG